MSAQGTTLRRGTAHVPMWPLAVLVAVAAAIVLAASLFDTRPSTPIEQVTLVERFANSGAIPAASTAEASGPTTFGPVTLVERFANSGVIPAASMDEASRVTTFAPVTLVERLANSGVIPAPSISESGGATANPCPEACQLARRG
jgi:hypothetical protein